MSQVTKDHMVLLASYCVGSEIPAFDFDRSNQRGCGYRD